MRKMVRSIILGAVLGAAPLALPAFGEAIDISFDAISTNSGAANTNVLEQQFNLRIEMSTNTNYAGMAAFTFSNVGSLNANISEIYWGWSGLTALGYSVFDPFNGFDYVDPSGDNWTLKPPDSVSPDDVPGPATFSFASDAAADGAADGDGNGVQADKGLWTGEPAVTFYMGFSDSYVDTYATEAEQWQILRGILLGNDNFLQFGFHVRSIGTTGKSDGFVSIPGGSIVTAPVPVPVPAAAGLGFLGLALIGVIRRKKS